MDVPTRFVSIDPGDRHVGWAEWHNGECTEAVELTPEECIARLEGGKLGDGGLVEVVVCERSSLYGWAAHQQTGSEFKTPQLIGVIKYLCRKWGIEFVGQQASQGKSVYRTSWYKAANKRRMPWYGSGNHAKDAWAHGHEFIRMRRKQAV